MYSEKIRLVATKMRIDPASSVHGVEDEEEEDDDEYNDDDDDELEDEENDSKEEKYKRKETGEDDGTDIDFQKDCGIKKEDVEVKLIAASPAIERQVMDEDEDEDLQEEEEEEDNRQSWRRKPVLLPLSVYE